MPNIIYEEQRFLKKGEVCAIELKNIKGYQLLTTGPEDGKPVFYATGEYLSAATEITFIKYLGNGMFMDLVSDQLLIGALINYDDFGSDEFESLDFESQNEIKKVEERYHVIYESDNIEDFKDSLSIFLKNPLTIDVGEPELLSITSDVAKKFASQSLDQVKSKIISAKLTAQQNIHETYIQMESEIFDFYTPENASRNRK